MTSMSLRKPHFLLDSALSLSLSLSLSHTHTLTLSLMVFEVNPFLTYMKLICMFRSKIKCNGFVVDDGLSNLSIQQLFLSLLCCHCSSLHPPFLLLLSLFSLSLSFSRTCWKKHPLCGTDQAVSLLAPELVVFWIVTVTCFILGVPCSEAQR